MLPDPNDTIVALASPSAPGGRGIVRLSGKEAFSLLRTLGIADILSRRTIISTQLHLPGLFSRLPCAVYVFPAPTSYTGENVAELHTIGSLPLLDLLVTSLLNSGARAAQPGEFTLRAFRNGKLDLTRAEAVLGVIEATSKDELKTALAQLAGGLTQPLNRLREDLLNLLADVEAGLDFVDEDISFVPQDQLLLRLTTALAQVTMLKKQIEQRSRVDRPFRVVLAGSPNAGKSTLFNILLGRSAALVSPQPGTTRDYLEGTLDTTAGPVVLVDTAGLRDGGDPLETEAQILGRGQQVEGDLVLWCRPAWPADTSSREPAGNVLTVWTKCDLAPPPAEGIAISAATRQGIANLRTAMEDRVRERPESALAPSLSRCRHHVDTCLACLRRAHAVALEGDPPEILALEIRSTLDELGAMAGTVFTDDLLDRIFSRFCIGK